MVGGLANKTKKVARRVSFNYDGSYPLNREKPPKGVTIKQFTIRNWTNHNCQLAAKRRCYHIMDQLRKLSPNAQWANDIATKVYASWPMEYEAVETELCQAIAIWEQGGIPIITDVPDIENETFDELMLKVYKQMADRQHNRELKKLGQHIQHRMA